MNVLLLLACPCTVVAGTLRYFDQPAPAAQLAPVAAAPRLRAQPHDTSRIGRDGR